MNTSDLTFIVNTRNENLKKRFNTLIKDAKNFDCLVGYFYVSGFVHLQDSLSKTEKIRILIGISTDTETQNLIENAQLKINFSNNETKSSIENTIINEFADTSDNFTLEESVKKFVSLLRNKKLEIRAYPSKDIHAKLYIITFKEGDRDIGRVITGSSNFSTSGLVENLEFNVELKNRSDYDFASEQFNDLWNSSIDVSKEFIETINGKTWINNNITPHDLYLKFLYEYFKEQLNLISEISSKYIPFKFKKLEYQDDAVINAKKILLEYGGVFISDVVGLGKTYMTTMLVGQLEGRTLVLAPPRLLDRSNPGSWINAFSDFRISADFESIGKLDSLLNSNLEKYSNVVIDEAHRFRTDTTGRYEDLSEICRGKRIILVTATPYNNFPKDILNLIKLFQKSKKSTIPNLPNLDIFFSNLEKKLKGVDKNKNYNEYLNITKQNSREIRDKVLKYLMVRRTRTEIEKYYPDDLKKQKIEFPEVEKPTALFYQLNKEEDNAFNETINILANKIKYSRYTALNYLNSDVEGVTTQQFVNMGRFMKILLIKRLESSFHAFKKSLERFIKSYNFFIQEFKNGYVYISKNYSNRILDLLHDGEQDEVEKLISDGKGDKYESKNFDKELLKDLEKDQEYLIELNKLWLNINTDPKVACFKETIKSKKILQENHLVIFTESTETAEYLYKNLQSTFDKKIILFSGESSESQRDKVIDNFDANSVKKSDEFRVLISTEVLSEGVNLHRSNVVINYDIPWNPTRMMQRVGRINRIDTEFKKIYTFNFFPTTQTNSQIKLRQVAEAKINAFLTLLGGDAALLTDNEPIGSHELWDKLNSKNTLLIEDEYSNESELEYLKEIKDIRENNIDLFNKIKLLPKKSRSSKSDNNNQDKLITYFRKNKIQKFFIADKNGSKELDFISAAKILKTKKTEIKMQIHKNFYNFLEDNKNQFILSTTDEITSTRLGVNENKVIKDLKGTLKIAKNFTDDQENYVKDVIQQLSEGGIPKKTVKNLKNELKELGNSIINPLRVLAILQKNVSPNILKPHYSENSSQSNSKREVILSMCLTK